VRETVEGLRPIPEGGAEISVDIEGFGRIRIRVEAVDGVVHVALDSDEPTALARLEAHRQGLADALARDGFGSQPQPRHHPEAARPHGRPIVPKIGKPPAVPRSHEGMVDIVA
jgi:hypothetical protein